MSTKKIASPSGNILNEEELPKRRRRDNSETDQYVTRLTPEDEASFQSWYKDFASNRNLDLDPDAKEHHYDYRGYWNANRENPNPTSEDGHLPDTWKTPGHETFSNESIYAKYAPEMAGRWENGQYIEPGTDTAPTTTVTTTPTNPTPKATTTPNDDEVRQNVENAYRQQNQTFSDILNAYKTDYDREQQESLNAQKANVRAARWAGATELATSLANLFAVGEGNAVSQVYQPVSQNWMEKAEEESRYRRSRIDDIRQRQRAMEMQMAQMRSEEAMQLAKYDQDKQARDMEYALNQARIEYQNAQTAYYNARTDAQRQEADQKMKEAEKRLQYLDEQINAQKALANSRNASAYSSRTRADAQASSVENQNTNRNSRTESQNSVDRAREQNLAARTAAAGRSGLQYRGSSGSGSTSTQSGGNVNNNDNTPPSRRR